MIELIYCLFLLSGVVKSFLQFYAGGLMVVDFTLLCALLLVAVYILQFNRDFFFRNTIYLVKSSRSVIFILVGFFLWMAVTLIYTVSPAYSYIKIFMFLSNLVAVLFPFIYRGFNPKRFFHLFAYVGTGLIFLYTALFPGIYASYLKDIEYRGMVIKYLDIGYLAGLIILILAFVCPRMKKFIKILLIGINAWTLLVCAARGPLLFLVLVLAIRFAVSLVTFMKSRRLNFKNIFYMIASLGLLGTAAYYLIDRYALLLERSIARLLMLLDPEGSESILERITEVSYSFERIFENAANFLFGSGIGSFGILYEGLDERNYPHNVVLETWFELGLIGVILFILLLLAYFKKIRSRLNLVLIFIYLLLNSLKSYSLIDLRIMFGMFSALLIYLALRPDTWIGACPRIDKGASPLVPS
jgi:O-antigen ligase